MSKPVLLVVEDDLGLQRQLRWAYDGYEVVVAGDRAAALEAVPEVAELSMACPNKHYVPINLAPLGLENGNRVFVATDEPHGQIECTVGR